MSMDGYPNTRIVVHNLKGSWPNGITIDFTTRRMFWTDSKLQVIESSNLDGSDRRQVIAPSRQRPHAITVFEDHIYWTDRQQIRIYKANKFTGKNRTKLISGTVSMTGLEMYHPLRQPKGK